MEHPIKNFILMLLGLLSTLRACFSIVAANVRRRRFGQLSSGNPPPHVGGYGVLKHVLKMTEALRRLVGGAAHHAILLLATLALLLAGSERTRAPEPSVPKEHQTKPAFLSN